MAAAAAKDSGEDGHSGAPSEGTLSAMCQLCDEKGAPTGAQVVLPLGATVKQLDDLLCSILEKDEDRDVPYAFFLGTEQIATTLSAVLHKHQRDAWIEKALKEGRRVRPQDVEAVPLVAPEEVVLRIQYKPQAVFRVRPVSRCSATLDGHSEAVLVVSFSADGKILATGGGDNEIRLWDVDTLTPTQVLKGHAGWVQVLSWAPDGAHLASGSRDGGLLLWAHDGDYSNMRSSKMKGHSNYLSHVAWEPLSVNMDCNRFVSASKDATLKVWQVGIGLVFPLSGHESCVTCVKWGGMGFIYSSSQDRSIIVWSAQDGSIAHQLKGHGHWVNVLALNTDAVIRSGAFDHEKDQVFASKKEAHLHAKQRFDKVIQRSETERLISGSDDNTMFLWTPLREGPSSSSKQVARLTGHQGIVFHIAFSPDGSLVASCSADKSVKLWNAITGAFMFTFRGHVAAVYHVSWSLDSRLLVSGSRDSTLKLWSVAKKELVEDLSGHNDEIFSTDWSPDGQRVATGSKDKKVKVWVH